MGSSLLKPFAMMVVHKATNSH